MQTLAAMGHKLSDEEAEKVFADTRSDLILHYFERFKGDQTAATRFVLQHALKFVDAQNRVAILKMFAEQGEHLNRLYFAAATFDPGIEVQDWIQSYASYHPITPEVLREFKDQTVRGFKGLLPVDEVAPTQNQVTAELTNEHVQGDIEPTYTEDLSVKRIEVYKDLPTVDLTNSVASGRDKMTAKNSPKTVDPADDGFESLGGKEVKYKRVKGELIDENGRPVKKGPLLDTQRTNR